MDAFVASFLSILPVMGARSSGNFSDFSVVLFAILSASAIPLFWSEDQQSFTGEPALSILVSSFWMACTIAPLLFVNMSSVTLESVAKLRFQQLSDFERTNLRHARSGFLVSFCCSSSMISFVLRSRTVFKENPSKLSPKVLYPELVYIL
jgi:hypothetical protein